MFQLAADQPQLGSGGEAAVVGCLGWEGVCRFGAGCPGLVAGLQPSCLGHVSDSCWKSSRLLALWPHTRGLLHIAPLPPPERAYLRASPSLQFFDALLVASNLILSCVCLGLQCVP